MKRATGADKWFVLHDGAHTAAFNMALDEVLLTAAPWVGRPVLRFYGWTEPAATFGYSQRYAEVARMTALRPLVRRPTGGGVVPHDRSFTYTLAIPPTHAWYGLKARDSYSRIHDWLRRAFATLGWQTQLAPAAPSAVPGQCFERAEQNDVLWQGAKIAGAAQRRTRRGLLIQGAVQPPPGAPHPVGWPAAMIEVGTAEWEIVWAPFEIPDELRAQVEDLARGKYGTDAYNRRR